MIIKRSDAENLRNLIHQVHLNDHTEKWLLDLAKRIDAEISETEKVSAKWHEYADSFNKK